MVTDKPNCSIKCSLLSSRRTTLRGLLVDCRPARKKYEDQNRRVKKEKSQKTSEVRSEIYNLCSVVTETFGVLSLFGVMQCYSYSKIEGVMINCSSTWRIPNKSSGK
jgi:hypothetical protein